MTNSLISIVVPIYKVERYLERCLESIKEQTYKNFEVILVNDGSPENEEEICLRICSEDSRFSYFRKENGGLSDARNYGMQFVKGEYVTFVDSDDFIKKEYLEHLMQALTENSECDISAVSICYKSENSENLFEESYPKACYDKKASLEALCYSRGLECYAWGKLFRVSLFDNIQFTKGRLFEDIDIMWKLFLCSSGIAVVPACDYVYLQRKGSILHSNFNKASLVLLSIMEEMEHGVLAVYPEMKAAVARRKVFSASWLYAQCIKDEDCREVEEMLTRYIKKEARIVMADKQANYKDKIKILLIGLGSKRLYQSLYSRVSKKRG